MRMKFGLFNAKGHYPVPNFNVKSLEFRNAANISSLPQKIYRFIFLNIKNPTDALNGSRLKTTRLLNSKCSFQGFRINRIVSARQTKDLSKLRET